jgi:adhesin transport system membrane fusion protein
MLNISKNSIGNQIDSTKYSSLKIDSAVYKNKSFIRITFVLLVLLMVLLLAPWTQYVRGDGTVTALRPDQRPQTIQNTIAGKIEKWYVQEGELVDVGDTILFLSEIKTEYFDPELINRVKEQVDAKALAIGAYEDKLKALDQQITSLNDLQRLNLQTIDNDVERARFKVTSDSAAWVAAKVDFETQQKRLERQEELYKEGLVSLTELESRRLKLQSAQAGVIKAQNIYRSSVNAFITTLIEQDQVVIEYAEKISEVRSKRSSAGTELYNGIADMSKMKNQLSNYQLRSEMNYVLAPIRGYVNQALQVGIGENLKENSSLVTIVPEIWDKAVEVYIKPIDLPLVKREGKVMLLFDGWPSVVFSGWPDLSYGTFPGKVAAIDYNISSNGMYRVLIAENEEKPWPEELKVGSGSRGIMMLKNVPLWYELWRQLNGFPPDYYVENK